MRLVRDIPPYSLIRCGRCRCLMRACTLIAVRLRSGGLPAEDFVREFRRICGSQPEATAVLLDLAALLPSREQQLALQLACQGAAVSAPQTDSQPAGNSVAGIMRSVAAAPAGEMASQGAGATAPAEASGAAEQTPVVAASDADDLEAAADSSVRATAGAVDLGAGKAAVPAVEDMLDSSWTASHDSRCFVGSSALPYCQSDPALVAQAGAQCLRKSRNYIGHACHLQQWIAGAECKRCRSRCLTHLQASEARPRPQEAAAGGGGGGCQPGGAGERQARRPGVAAPGPAPARQRRCRGGRGPGQRRRRHAHARIRALA